MSKLANLVWVSVELKQPRRRTCAVGPSVGLQCPGTRGGRGDRRGLQAAVSP
jgi:hypothetical protein